MEKYYQAYDKRYQQIHKFEVTVKFRCCDSNLARTDRSIRNPKDG